MSTFLLILIIAYAALLLSAGLLHLIARLKPLEAFATALCCAPGLDVAITWFTVSPIIVGGILDGWRGIAAGIIAQFCALVSWTILHEMAHPEARRGPRIYKYINKQVGWFRNYTALIVTTLVVPIFWLARVAELTLYPLLVVLVRFPKYKQREWVNVSRQKFRGLVGHDLIWCLYCDWMTGVWSFATEILRNVESFWCPIRFSSEAKCDNCRHDFPDIDGGWVAADQTMSEVVHVLEEKYRGQGSNSWFGHPARLTVEGERIDTDSGAGKTAG